MSYPHSAGTLPALILNESNFYYLLQAYLDMLDHNSMTSRTKIRITNRRDLSAIDIWMMVCFVETLWPYQYGLITTHTIELSDKKKKKKKKKISEEETRHCLTDKSIFTTIFDQTTYLLMSTLEEDYMEIFRGEPDFLESDPKSTKIEWVLFQLFNQSQRQEVRFWFQLSHIKLFMAQYQYLSTLTHITDTLQYVDPHPSMKEIQEDQCVILRGGESLLHPVSSTKTTNEHNLSRDDLAQSASSSSSSDSNREKHGRRRRRKQSERAKLMPVDDSSSDDEVKARLRMLREQKKSRP